MRPHAALICLVLACLLVFTNVYLGLKIGLAESGNLLTASLAVALGHTLRRPLRVEESYLAQAFASSAGACTTVTGLVTIVPILDVRSWLIIPWGAALGVLGVLIGAFLRDVLLEREELVFPTGVATAETITALHAQGGTAGIWSVGAGFGVASIVAALRDFAGWVPGILNLTLVGIGVLIGPAASVAMFAGALAIAWIAPAQILWVAVALMLSEPVWLLLTNLARAGRAFTDVGAGLSRSRLPAVELAVAAAAAGIAIVVGHLAFGLPPLIALAVLAVAILPAAAVARAAGRTDYIPGGDAGQLTQSIVGLGGRATGLASGVAVMGTSTYASIALINLKAGRLLGQPWRRSVAVQAAGAVFGAACGVGAYLLLTRHAAPGSAALPAPTVQAWRAVSDAVAGGAPLEALVAFAAGLILCAVRHRFPWVPPPVLLGIGAILSPTGAGVLAVGGVLAFAARRLRKQWADAHLAKLAAGSIMGESLVGVAGGLLRG